MRAGARASVVILGLLLGACGPTTPPAPRYTVTIYKKGAVERHASDYWTNVKSVVEHEDGSWTLTTRNTTVTIPPGFLVVVVEY